MRTTGIAIAAVLAFGLFVTGCSSAKPPPVQARKPATKPGVAAADAGIAPPAVEPIATDELEPLLRNDSEIAALIDEGSRRRLQVLAAFPTKTKDGRMTLHRSGLRLDAEYFYPASSVKLLAAYAAIEKIDDMGEDLGGIPVPITTPIRYVHGEGRSKQVVTATLRRDLEKALVISDNDSFDRIYDFVGKEELAERLARIGIKRTVIVQHLGRLAKTRSSAPPLIDLLMPDGAVPVSYRLGFEIPNAPLSAVQLGRAYIDDRGKVVQGPMDFSKKNAAPLGDLQDVLIALARPELYDRMPDGATLKSPTARQETLDLLTKLPSVLEGTWRGRPNAKDAMHKPLQVALGAAFPDEKVRVYGKGGRAYGFTVENAYIVSERTGRGFFLTAALYANDNDTLNDDGYEYLSIGTPFLARLGVMLAKKVFREPETR